MSHRMANHSSSSSGWLQTDYDFRHIWLGLFIFWHAPAFSLASDNTQVIQVQAGHADINAQTHRGVYINDVQLDQGTTHLRATKAITLTDAQHHLTQINIYGCQDNPAHYWTKISTEKPELHAYADIIRYYPLDRRIELIGHARVEQGQHAFQAPFIQYDIDKQRVQSKQIGSNRTTITIHTDQTI